MLFSSSYANSSYANSHETLIPSREAAVFIINISCGSNFNTTFMCVDETGGGGGGGGGG